MGFSTVTSSIIIFSGLMVSLILLGSTMLNSWYNMAIAVKSNKEILEKPEILIDELNMSCSGDKLTIALRNNGPSILWDFNSADLIVTYVDNSGVKNSYLLKYGVDWNITHIVSPYGKKFNYTEGIGVYPRESILINATLPSPASLNYPILIVFVDQHGSIAYHRWFGGACYG